MQLFRNMPIGYYGKAQNGDNGTAYKHDKESSGYFAMEKFGIKFHRIILN
jgi:hypothetical protein